MNLMEGRKEEVPDWKKLIVKNRVLVLTTKEQLGLTVKKEAAAAAEKRVVARADLRIRSLKGGRGLRFNQAFLPQRYLDRIGQHKLFTSWVGQSIKMERIKCWINCIRKELRMSC